MPRSVPPWGGYIAEHAGFGAAFLVLGGIAALAIPVFLKGEIEKSV